MQIALKLKSMEPQTSDQSLTFTYLVSSKEFGDLELKLLVPTQADLTAAEQEARKKVEEFADALRTACQDSPIPTVEKLRPHP
jgi:hypothetical protein